MLTTEQLNEMLEAARPSIVEGFKKEIAQSITYNVRQQAGEMVSKHVTQWVTEHVLPEVSALLLESKQGLIAIGAELAPLMVASITESLMKQLKERLEQSWKRGEIFKAMFS